MNSTKSDRHIKLFEFAKEKELKILKKKEKLEIQRNEKDMEECSFKPSLFQSASPKKKNI